jgi:hypothetical protein
MSPHWCWQQVRDPFHENEMVSAATCAFLFKWTGRNCCWENQAWGPIAAFSGPVVANLAGPTLLARGAQSPVVALTHYLTKKQDSTIRQKFLCGNHSICPSNREFCTSCNLVGNQCFSWFYQLSGREKEPRHSVSQNSFVPSFLSSIEDTFPLQKHSKNIFVPQI